MLNLNKHLTPAVFMLLVYSAANAATPACDPDHGGITLPPGFCALVVLGGDGGKIGTARHLAVAAKGDVYVALEGTGEKGGVLALRDTTGTGKFDVREHFGSKSVTGVVLHNGYLYIGTRASVERYKMTNGQLSPSGEPEIIATFAPETRHPDKGLAFDGRGSVYVNVGAPSNACQKDNGTKMQPGQDPCPLLEKFGGIWKFDENKLNQTQEDGVRFASGLRQEPAITWHDGALYIVMNSRDQLDTLWGTAFTAQENAERPAEPMFRAGQQGLDFGWPYCFWDYGMQKFLTNPEYGGDGKKSDRCDKFTAPVVSFPAHWAPVDVMFYDGTQFPAKYKDGAFIAFHGSWNRAPLPMAGYNVTFQPFENGKPSGKFEVFASGFPGVDPLMRPNDAAARPDGVAQAPDGSLYITDSQKGKIWRVIYTGSK
jgi:glucose/arabinose dehydrogenase